MTSRASTITIYNFIIEQTAVYAAITYSYLAAFVIVGIMYQPSLLLYALITLSAAIFIIPYPIIGLGATVVLTMIFERFFTLQSLVIDQQVYKLYPLDIVIVLTIIGILVGAIYDRAWPRINWQISDRLLLLFIVYTTYKFIISLGLDGTDTAVAFSSFKNYAIYPVIYFITIILLRTKSDWTNMLKTIVGAGVAIITFIIIGVAMGEGLWTEYTPLSTSGVRLLAGTHAFYLTLVIMIVAAMIAQYRRSWRIVMISLVMIWLFGIAGSLMRHIWLALIVGGASILAIISGSERTRLVRYGSYCVLIGIATTMTVVWLVTIFPNPDIQAKLDQTFDTTVQRAGSLGELSVDTSAGWRVVVWQSALTRWLEDPIRGVGFGQSILIKYKDWQATEYIRNIHNSPLAITVQMGIIGTGLLALWVYSILNYGYRTMRVDRDRTVFAGLIAGVVVIGFSSLFQPYLETNLTGIFLWLLAGMIRVGGEQYN